MDRPSKFELFLRTGRLTAPISSVEIKFNPWHDPDDGRFAFAGRGRHFPGGRQRRVEAGFQGGGGNGGGGGASGSWSQARQVPPAYSRFDPKNPRNYSHHVVRRGDTLTSIAAMRKGLKVSDLVWLNDMRASQSLSIRQLIKVPDQNYLDAGRRAKNNFVALAHYLYSNSSLPPNPADAPSLSGNLKLLVLGRFRRTAIGLPSTVALAREG